MTCFKHLSRFWDDSWARFVYLQISNIRKSDDGYDVQCLVYYIKRQSRPKRPMSKIHCEEVSGSSF